MTIKLRDEYRRPIEYGVWYDWQGGECPVDGDTVVYVRLASGDEDGGKATSFYWNHDGDGADIVAYRVVEPDDIIKAADTTPEKISSTSQPADQQETDWKQSYESLNKATAAEEAAVDNALYDAFKDIGGYDNKAETPWEAIARLRKMVPTDQPAEAVQIAEKQRRVFYQDLLYKVCSWIDNRLGGMTFTGTVEYPKGNVMERLEQAAAVRPPEETPAEKRLKELGVERDGKGNYWTSDCSGLLAAYDFTFDQLEAIITHIQEQKGGEGEGHLHYASNMTPKQLRADADHMEKEREGGAK